MRSGGNLVVRPEARRLAKRIPGLRPTVRYLRRLRQNLVPAEPIFEQIYGQNVWGGSESASGEGSDLVQTRRIREELPALWRRYNVRRVLDAPCGDFNWMREIVSGLDEYVGLDIVAVLIEQNNRQYGNSRIRFQHANLIKDRLPESDLILCRDCFVHFSFHDIWRALANMKRSGAQYLLATTFTARAENEDILTGQWKVRNLQGSPFNFPEPLEIVNEGCTEAGGQYADKSLALWRLADLPQAVRVRG
jgi:hypothetical protein